MVSHTSTGEWQSFEVRMRRRRAERLLLRAEAAVEAGHLDDARMCLSEAKALVPDMPGLEAVELRLSPSPRPSVTKVRRRTAIVAVVIAVVATVLFAAWPRGSRPDVPAKSAAVADPTTPAPAAVPEPPRQEPGATSPQPLATSPQPLSSPAETLPPPASVFTSEIAALPGTGKPLDKPVDPQPVRRDAPASVEEPADTPPVSRV